MKVYCPLAGQICPNNIQETIYCANCELISKKNRQMFLTLLASQDDMVSREDVLYTLLITSRVVGVSESERFDLMVEGILALPSLSKDLIEKEENRWIPVSEKLPDEEDYNEYLVTDKDGYMAVGNYRHDAGAWDSINFGWLEIKDKADEFPWGIGKVVAWWSQPLFYDRSNI